jgi:hypothetical protein
MRAAALSQRVLKLDGAFLLLSGGSAMIAETVGHFSGSGPMAKMKGSPYTIGSFEAHGLAVISGVLLSRAAYVPERSLWHQVGRAVHLLLAGSNLLYWSSFRKMDMVRAGIVTTLVHAVFVAAHSVGLRRPVAAASVTAVN